MLSSRCEIAQRTVYAFLLHASCCGDQILREMIENMLLTASQVANRLDIAAILRTSLNFTAPHRSFVCLRFHLHWSIVNSRDECRRRLAAEVRETRQGLRAIQVGVCAFALNEHCSIREESSEVDKMLEEEIEHLKAKIEEQKQDIEKARNERKHSRSQSV